MAEGFAPPLHIHYNEDETFFVLEGEFRFQLGGTTRSHTSCAKIVGRGRTVMRCVDPLARRALAPRLPLDSFFPKETISSFKLLRQPLATEFTRALRPTMADQTLARYVNELSVLTLLRTHGPASRAELARKLAVTPATLTRLVTVLAGRGLVREIKQGADPGTAREPGRPGVAVALDPRGAYFLGVEIGVGVVRTAVLDLAASVVASSATSVPKHFAAPDAAELIASIVAQLEAEPAYHSRIRSIGVTVPGLVTMEGFVIHLPILGWRDVGFSEAVASKVNLPCVVENNANAAAFGAVYTEPSLPSLCTIFLKLGTGCGGAAIINGRLLRGGSGTAGEMGHIRLTDDGHPCSCGQRGCLESWVNLAALARGFRGTDELEEKELAALPAEATAAADRGDTAAQKALASITQHLGRGIVTLVNVFNPTSIVLGGIMRPVLERCLPELRGAVELGIVPGTAMPELRLSALGEFECAIGAACLAHHRTFDLSRVDLSRADAASPPQPF